MKNCTSYILILTVAIFTYECKSDSFKNMNYLVKKIKNNSDKAFKQVIDGIWEKAILLDDFIQPWNDNFQQKTQFKALYNDEYLYLRYDVNDDNILIYNKTNTKLDVAQSDRVEIFFRKDKDLEEYYCIEVDPNGKVLDYEASYYRKFNYSWSWPEEQLFAKSNYVKGGYRVDLTISLESLRNLGLLKENIIEVGVYRGDCIGLPKSEMEEANINWITWIDPKTKTPDFHIPSSFGKLRLTD